MANIELLKRLADATRREEFVKGNELADEIDEIYDSLIKRYQWVPVDEQLPPHSGMYVLVSCEGGKVTDTFYTLDTEWLVHRGRNAAPDTLSGYFRAGVDDGYKILAWMRVPDAYFPEQEGE